MNNIQEYSEQFRFRMILVEQATYEARIKKLQEQLRFRLNLGIKAQ